MQLYVDSRFLSPYAMSAFVGLEEKEIPFELHTVDLKAGVNRADSFTNLSLTQRVPTLVQGGFSLSESSAITEYLDDAFPGPLLYPQELRAKARARQIQAWLRSDLMALRKERPTEVLFHGPIDEPLSETANEAAQKLIRVATALLAHGGGNLLFAWSIADADLALMLNRLVMNDDPVPARLVEYAQLQWERPSIQAWVKKPRTAG